MENRGNVSKAMKEAGYEEQTAKNPKNLTESKGWAELVETYLPDTLLAKKHKQLLTSPKKIRRFFKGELEEEIEELDTTAIKWGLDMAYKVKGKYKDDNEQKRTHVVVNVERAEEIKKALSDI